MSSRVRRAGLPVRFEHSDKTGSGPGAGCSECRVVARALAVSLRTGCWPPRVHSSALLSHVTPLAVSRVLVPPVSFVPAVARALRPGQQAVRPRISFQPLTSGAARQETPGLGWQRSVRESQGDRRGTRPRLQGRLRVRLAQGNWRRLGARRNAVRKPGGPRSALEQFADLTAHVRAVYSGMLPRPSFRALAGRRKQRQLWEFLLPPE